jgi:hypothetical protein
MRATGLSERELSGELSAMLSRVGFLKSFDDELLGEAREALEDALRIGEADGWVTRWNLANVAARQSDTPSAKEQLAKVIEEVAGWNSTASLLIFVPGRAAADSLVNATPGGFLDLLELQRAVVDAVAAGDGVLNGIVERCRASDDVATAQAASWVAESFPGPST